MILLHGFTGSSQSWGDPILDGLTSAGHLPVLVDLPGHGARAGERDPAAYTLDATLEAIGRAQGPEPAPLVGYSMGGRVALAYAVRFPERITHLVLESASPGLEDAGAREARRAADEALAARIEDEGVRAFVDAWEALPLFASQRALPDAVRTAHRARRLLNDAAGLASALRALGTGSLPSYWDALPDLRVPTLLLTGRLDTKFFAIARRMCGVLPDCARVEVEASGHTVHLERPEAWLAQVLAFVGGGRS